MGKRTQKNTSAKKTSEKIDISQRADTPIIEIATPSDESQILVSLRKVPQGGGASAWLSPVGWSDVKKSTLLDCYENAAGCEIIIPDTYAKEISDGDKIYLSCTALNVRGDIAWRAPEAVIEATPEPTVKVAAPTGLMSRLLSRGTPEAVTPVADVAPESDAKRRTVEAQKLADEYRAQMEKAASAREEAQRQALEAARRAEDALQAESERIAEMEKAAKAFAEAEAQRQDEERRLDAERRAEELRLAEEARLIEEARQRELAIARAAERAEEKARLVALQEDASNQRAALAERIEATRSSLHRLDVDRKAKADTLNSLTDSLADKETELSILAQELNAQKGGLGALDERLVIANARDADAKTSQDQMQGSVTAAARALEEAEAEVKAAMARAKQRKSDHDALLSDMTEITQRVEKAARDLSALHAERSKADAAVLKAQEVYDAAQAASDAQRAKMDGLIHDDASIEAAQATHKGEMDRLARDLDTALSRQDAAKAALQTLEDGGDVRAARQIMASVDDAPDMSAAPIAEAASTQAKTMNAPVSKINVAGLFGKKKAAAVPAVKPKAPVSVSASTLAVPTKVLVQDDKASAHMDDNTASGIMAAQIAANNTGGFSVANLGKTKFAAMGVGAIALSIALGLGVSSMTRPNVEQSVSVKPAPTEVLSIETRATDTLKPQDIVTPQETTPVPEKASLKETASLDTQTAPIVTPPPVDVPKVVTPDVKATVKVAELKVEPKYKSINVSRMARQAARQDDVARKEAARIAAREASRLEAARLAAAKKEESRKEAAPISAAPKPEPKAAPVSQQTKAKDIVRVAEIARDVAIPPVRATIPAPSAPAANPAILNPIVSNPAPTVATGPTMSLAITRDVQDNLQRLGYYSGPVDGVMRAELREAAALFNTIYDRPAGDVFSGEFVTQLATTVNELNAVQAAPPVQAASIAAPVQPVVTSNLPLVQPVETGSAVAPAPREAALTTPAIAPAAIADRIVEPKLIDNMQISYPSKAMRREIYKNVSVEVSYDIGVDGAVVNARVSDIDYTGRLSIAFEEEALKGVRAMKYAPKTVNGEAVSAPGQSKRVRFQIE
ncbi:energy transducer TonB [Fretibacter rubidus]|uniref:energy transducer TonB n=1 Tax=Fretibacter rubidus TaxID=570162 RepID=UPI00352B4A3D